MSDRVNRKKDVENNTAVACAGSNQDLPLALEVETLQPAQILLQQCP